MVVHEDVVCIHCGCLCDDLVVEVEDDRITKVKKACGIGRNKFLHAQSDTPVPSIAGREVSVGEAVAEAARLLRQARNPLVYGLSSTTAEAQAEAVELAELLGGCLDNVSSY